jgi:cytochrome b6-f complex iron-sulfur subunit
MEQTTPSAQPATPSGPASVAAQPAGSGDRWQWLDEQVGRRQFLLKAGWGFFWLFLGGWLLSNLRYLFPNVLYEPRLSFKAGRPDEYPLGVSNKWKKDQRVWIVRQEQGFYCLWARCTHLGCTPNWFDAEGRFKCPCHGSNFNRDGDVIAGPAPKPLWRCAIQLADDGQLVVDKARLENRRESREGGEFFLPYQSA